MDEDVLNGESWDFSKENATEGVGDGGIDADEGEGGVKGVIFVELDAKGLV